MRSHFKGANLTNANLQQAYLTGANLDQTDVEIDNIPGNYNTRERISDLSDLLNGSSSDFVLEEISKEVFPTDFLGANLEGANLSNTSLDKVIFDRANPIEDNFTESSLDADELEIEGVKLCGVILPNGSTSDRDCE